MKANGVDHVVAGKTGTGDHRSKTFAGRGRLIESRVVNRAATFVFMIDGRFFGNVTAFVPGADAAHYQFTSSLPVRVLGLLLPRSRAYAATRERRAGDVRGSRLRSRRASLTVHSPTA